MRVQRRGEFGHLYSLSQGGGRSSFNEDFKEGKKRLLFSMSTCLVRDETNEGILFQGLVTLNNLLI